MIKFLVYRSLMEEPQHDHIGLSVVVIDVEGELPAAVGKEPENGTHCVCFCSLNERKLLGGV